VRQCRLVSKSAVTFKYYIDKILYFCIDGCCFLSVHASKSRENIMMLMVFLKDGVIKICCSRYIFLLLDGKTELLMGDK
jgi:hypothetical protein